MGHLPMKKCSRENWLVRPSAEMSVYPRCLSCMLLVQSAQYSAQSALVITTKIAMNQQHRLEDMRALTCPILALTGLAGTHADAIATNVAKHKTSSSFGLALGQTDNYQNAQE